MEILYYCMIANLKISQEIENEVAWTILGFGSFYKQFNVSTLDGEVLPTQINGDCLNLYYC